MNKTTLRFIGQLILEAIVIWYGMGMPVPTCLEDTLKLIVGFVVIAYTGWKNHNFTSCSQQLQPLFKAIKADGVCILGGDEDAN